MQEILLITLRLSAACIFAIGAILLAMAGVAGWGWCIFASIILGCISYKSDKSNK